MVDKKVLRSVGTVMPQTQFDHSLTIRNEPKRNKEKTTKEQRKRSMFNLGRNLRYRFGTH